MLFVVGAITLLMGVFSISGGVQGALVPGVIAALCIAGLITLYRWEWITQASPDRALEIARQAGVDEEGVAQLRQRQDLPVPAVAAAPAQPWTPPES